MCESVETASEPCRPASASRLSRAKSLPSEQRRAVEVRVENALDQLLRHAPAAAVAHHDLVCVVQRHRASRAFNGGDIFQHTSNSLEAYADYTDFTDSLIVY